MSARTPEGRITEKIVAYLNGLPRCEARKVHSDPYGNVGEPDIDAVLSGRALKLEVKRPGTEAAITKAVTARQRSRLRAWERAGALAAVVTSIEDVEIVLSWAGAERLDVDALVRIHARLDGAP